MTMDDQNPFRVPEARVADPGTAFDGMFLLEGRKVPAGNGLTWISRGWEIFRATPGMWVLTTLVLMFCFLFFCFCFPTLILLPVFMGGLMVGCKAVDDGDELRIEHLFSCFSDHVGNLMIVGVIYVVCYFVIYMIHMVFSLASIPLGMSNNQELSFLLSMLGLLIMMALQLPLVMALWYAPALVVFHDVPPIDAMKASLMISIKNFWPFMLWGLVISLLGIPAMLPCGLGFLVLYPLMMASTYASYRDMFIQD